jgi:hypothetical protein
MLTTLLITLIILPVCVALLSISILLKKNGRFPDTHISSNQALRKQGIQCAASQYYEQLYRKNLEERLKEIIE